MTKIKIVEDLISAYIDNNQAKIINLLEKEIQISKKKGQYNVAKRLKNLVYKIPNNKTLSSQSGIVRRDVFQLKEENLLYEKIDSKIVLDEVILDPILKETICSFLGEWDDYVKLSKFGVFPTNKLLFYGPPGTGKTKLAYAIANYLNFPLVFVRLDELISSYLGKTGKNIREIFEIAKQESVVILLDEIDTIAKHRDDSKELGELKRIVTVLLQNIDVFPNNSIVIGATNNESLLDKAVWRRFNLKLQFITPLEQSREMLFRLFLGNFSTKINFSLLAELTEGFNGSMIFDISQAIKRHAILSGKKTIKDVDAVKTIISYGNILSADFKISKKNLYKIGQILSDGGFSLKEVELATGIPYTTLRDNIS